MALKAEDFLHPPKQAPTLDIPPGATVKVQIIDSTAKLEGPSALFMGPVQAGHETLRVPAFSFLVEQISSGRRILFDLGSRKDWQNHPPSVTKTITGPGWKIEIEKNVSEILGEAGIDTAEIEAIVWSHWHWDHVGDPSTFPPSTAVIAGPGMKEKYLPGYPQNKASPLLESALEGRQLKVIDFKNQPITIGRFRGFDYFNDGSFYLLDAPGHAIGHMCGLARVTSTQEGDEEDTFVFMGADTAHHGGEFRPTEYLPLHKSIQPSPYVKFPSICPGHLFETIHPCEKALEPYYKFKEGIPDNLEQANEACSRMQEFDAADNVFVVIAHDASLLDERVGIEWFPHGTLKNWKKNNWATKSRWGFLKDFTTAVEEAKT